MTYAPCSVLGWFHHDVPLVCNTAPRITNIHLQQTDASWVTAGMKTKTEMYWWLMCRLLRMLTLGAVCDADLASQHQLCHRSYLSGHSQRPVVSLSWQRHQLSPSVLMTLLAFGQIQENSVENLSQNFTTNLLSYRSGFGQFHWLNSQIQQYECSLLVNLAKFT